MFTQDFLFPTIHLPNLGLSLSRPSFDGLLGPPDIPLSMPLEMIYYVMNSNTNLYRPDRTFAQDRLLCNEFKIQENNPSIGQSYPRITKPDTQEHARDLPRVNALHLGDR